MPDRKAQAGVLRRQMLRRAGLALTGASLVASGAGATEADPAVPPWMTEQGAPVADDSYGSPSPYERSVVRRLRDKPAFPTAASAHTPLQDLTGIITPNGLHHVRSHAGTPVIDPARHTLLVHGLVER